MEFNPVTCISPYEARKIIALRGRKGLFWTIENGRYIGIDNRDGSIKIFILKNPKNML